ncbi:hypothetical protein [Caballeronia cordobensis]|uniref:hypothetical protein n=1 Tax=Caballeronia cordobensis TaxID=1353886 RepID=UPI00118712DB
MAKKGISSAFQFARKNGLLANVAQTSALLLIGTPLARSFRDALRANGEKIGSFYPVGSYPTDARKRQSYLRQFA